MHNEYELIGFDMCPYVHRTQIVLKLAGVKHKVTYIDLQNKPTWFLEISPTGKVPVLRIGDNILFESTAINEYINAAADASLLPTDPLVQAQNRAWTEYGSGLLMTLYRLLNEPSPEEINTLKTKFNTDLSHLENQLKSNNPYFNGKKISLIDAAFAPLFKRIATVEKYCSLNALEGKPKLKQWSDNLLKDEQIESIYPQDFEEKLINRLIDAQGYFASAYQASQKGK